MITLPASKTLSELLNEVLQEALDIGSDNWDGYLEQNRWPELKEHPRYKELVECLQQIDESYR